MKKITRMISVLLLLCLSLSLFACKNQEQTQEGGSSNATVASTNESGAELPFGKENYGKEVTILYYNGTMYKNFYFDDITDAGDIMQSALA